MMRDVDVDYDTIMHAQAITWIKINRCLHPNWSFFDKLTMIQDVLLPWQWLETTTILNAVFRI